MESDRTDSKRDLHHLRLLKIFHYIGGGISLAFGLLFITHIVIGLGMMLEPDVLAGSDSSTAAPFPVKWFGLMFVIMGSFAVTLHGALGVLMLVSGRMISRRKARKFSLVAAGINCFSVPIGTTLGVFTIIVLLRDSVINLYQEAAEDRRLK